MAPFLNSLVELLLQRDQVTVSTSAGRKVTRHSAGSRSSAEFKIYIWHSSGLLYLLYFSSWVFPKRDKEKDCLEISHRQSYDLQCRDWSFNRCQVRKKVSNIRKIQGTRDYSLLRLCHIMQGNSAECGETPDQVSKSHGTKCVTGSMEPVTNTWSFVYFVTWNKWRRRDAL